jgi:hypothetical protein
MSAPASSGASGHRPGTALAVLAAVALLALVGKTAMVSQCKYLRRDTLKSPSLRLLRDSQLRLMGTRASGG